MQDYSESPFWMVDNLQPPVFAALLTVFSSEFGSVEVP